MFRPSDAPARSQLGPCSWRWWVAPWSIIAAACTPPADPAWLIQRPTELSLHAEVIAYGPYGANGPSDLGRSHFDALPLDTVLLTPFVVDTDGPVPPQRLDLRWIACGSNNDCIEPLRRIDELPSCFGQPYPGGEPCAAGSEGQLEFVLGDYPELDMVSLFGLLSAPRVAFIGSTVEGRGAEACIESLATRSPLIDCLLMTRELSMGPPGELVLGAEEHGIEVELGEGTEIALLAPRNHNPAVEKFVVSGSSHLEADDVEVPMGSTVAVAVGDQITVRYVPDERDIEGFEFETSDGLLDIEETLFGQWRFDRNAADFTTVDLGATWTVDEQTDHAHLHLVVRDSRRAEAAGWLAFVIEP